MKKFIKTKIDDYLNENIGDERQGIGNFMETKNYNIEIKKELPLELINVHDSATVSKYWEDTLAYIDLEKQYLDKNKKLFSTQEYVSNTFINNMTDDIYNLSDIIIAIDKNDNYWILNGHHRLIYDRINSRHSFVYLLSIDDVKEIDYTFYEVE